MSSEELHEIVEVGEDAFSKEFLNDLDTQVKLAESIKLPGKKKTIRSKMDSADYELNKNKLKQDESI